MSNGCLSADDGHYYKCNTENVIFQQFIPELGTKCLLNICFESK